MVLKLRFMSIFAYWTKKDANLSKKSVVISSKKPKLVDTRLGLNVSKYVGAFFRKMAVIWKFSVQTAMNVVMQVSMVFSATQYSTLLIAVVSLDQSLR